MDNYKEIYLSDLIIAPNCLEAISIAEQGDNHVEVVVSGQVFELSHKDSAILIQKVCWQNEIPPQFQDIVDDYLDSIKDDDIDEIADSMNKETDDNDIEYDDMPF